MLNVDFIFEIITTLIGLAWIFMSRKFSTGTADGVPRAEYFPVRVGITLIIVSMILAIKGLKDKRKYFNRKEWSKENIKVFLLTILAVVVFIIL